MPLCQKGARNARALHSALLTRDGDGVVGGVARAGVRVAVDALDVKVVLGAESARLGDSSIGSCFGLKIT